MIGAVLSLAGSVLADDAVTPDPDTVTPGIIGFIVTFLVAIVTVLLIIDMVRRVRRVNYRDQVRQELEAELAAKNAVEGDSGPEGAGSGTDPAGR
ncbi:hypothetical protein [Herbiconiux ginsengi]|uniref:Uncharacterized protein n=1 Tax=Herbiconiux ginsengi TaxID=381665 RepID=A0A1H3SCB7_9MICO|nr:hypothetical protein [Herbiconiux ginsengi]SDZ35666.1 hypothetical protein SAMN05216554_3489 [Herbiconiux ginsengi]